MVDKITKFAHAVRTHQLCTKRAVERQEKDCGRLRASRPHFVGDLVSLGSHHRTPAQHIRTHYCVFLSALFPERVVCFRRARDAFMCAVNPFRECAYVFVLFLLPFPSSAGNK